tara:strand:+ start:411 stop:686 length:276 start_codon:yes stop_codon:yes gene_type:complete
MATHIKAIIDTFLKKKGDQFKYQGKIEQVLDTLFSPEIKKHIKLKKISKGQLIFSSKSSNFTYLFDLEKEKLLEEVQRVYPGVKAIKVETT